MGVSRPRHRGPGRTDSSRARAPSRARADRRGAAGPSAARRAAARSWPACSKARSGRPAPGGRRCCCSRARRASARAGCWRRCSPAPARGRVGRGRARHRSRPGRARQRGAGARSRGLLDLPGTTAAPPGALAALAAVLPAWAERFPSATSAEPVPLPRALTEIVGAASAEQPVVLALDDAQSRRPRQRARARRGAARPGVGTGDGGARHRALSAPARAGRAPQPDRPRPRGLGDPPPPARSRGAADIWRARCYRTTTGGALPVGGGWPTIPRGFRCSRWSCSAPWRSGSTWAPSRAPGPLRCTPWIRACRASFPTRSSPPSASPRDGAAPPPSGCSRRLAVLGDLATPPALERALGAAPERGRPRARRARVASLAHGGAAGHIPLSPRIVRQVVERDMVTAASGGACWTPPLSGRAQHLTGRPSTPPPRCTSARHARGRLAGPAQAIPAALHRYAIDPAPRRSR